MRLLFLAILLPAAAPCPQDPSRTEDTPTISPMAGDLRIWRAARKKLEPVASPLVLPPTDRVGSPKGDPVILMADDEAVLSIKGVKVAAGSGLAISRKEGAIVVKLDDGAALVDAFEKELIIDTPAGRASGKQAYFLVEVKEGVTKVTSIDGELTFSTPSGDVKLETSQESSASTGQEPSAPRATVVGDPAPSFAPRGAPVNLVRNPGYEEELAVGWGRLLPAEKVRSLDATKPLSGRQCLRARVTGETTKFTKPPYPTELGITTWVKFKKDRRYLVRVFHRTEVAKGDVQPVLWVTGIRSTDPDLNTANMIFEVLKSSSSWKMARFIVTSVATDGSLGIKASTPEETYDATFWLDDWSVVELPEPAK